MPKKHQVPTLIDLALQSIGQFVTGIGRTIVQPICMISKNNPAVGHAILKKRLQFMKHLLSSHVPWNLYDKMSTVTLLAIVNLINATKGRYNDYALASSFLSEVNVVVSLTEVVVDANLKSIEFPAWPKIMRNVLYNKLHEMTGLEVLDLGSGSAGWRTSDLERIIITAISVMPRLVCFVLCFDCTDNIISAISQNCKKLQKLDVTASRSVTDRSIPALLACRYLRDVKLCRTSITIAGYADLFLEHSSITDIGRCDEFGYVLELTQERENNFERFMHLKSFESRNFITKHLYLLIDMCPYITSLAILCDEQIDDLTILASLNDLRELKLLSCAFFTHGIKTLLELKGSKITSLHLEHVEEIDLNALIYISQFCPRIKSLVFYNCELLEQVLPRSRKFLVPPFKVLENIKCVAECINAHLEFLLSHCTNVKFIQLGSSTGVDDATMGKVLIENPMCKLEELKILYSHDLSMRTVQLLMQNCENLRRLSELESWQGISSVELEDFREELRINNINLDTSPTLSFA